VVEHITGTGSRQLRRRLKLSATDGTIVELDTENVHVSGTANASLLDARRARVGALDADTVHVATLSADRVRATDVTSAVI
jgi:hypothetical protein